MLAKEDIKVGDKFSVKEEVDSYRHIYYAGASGDFNPIHIDQEFGKKVGLGGIILHGLCTLGFVAKTVTTWRGDPGCLKRIKCRFAKPVHIGDIITIDGRVTDVTASKARIEFKVTNQGGEEVLTMASAEVDTLCANVSEALPTP